MVIHAKREVILPEWRVEWDKLVRPPAVAGKFYPKDKELLRKIVHTFLTESKTVPMKRKLKALIVPHAGYIYSGIVAGAGFRLLQKPQNQKAIHKVVLLGPSHEVYGFYGTSISAQNFSTPLGIVTIGPVQPLLKGDLVKILPDVHWHEHSLEVELPFLQEALGKFELYALVLGEVDEKELAEHLSQFINDDTFIVVSSDLSHYLDYNSAVKKDQSTIHQILHSDFSDLDACGERAVKVLMYLAKKLDWKPFLIDYQNSGDTTGDKSRVVGYAAIGYEK